MKTFVTGLAIILSLTLADSCKKKPVATPEPRPAQEVDCSDCNAQAGITEAILKACEDVAAGAMDQRNEELKQAVEKLESVVARMKTCDAPEHCRKKRMDCANCRR